MGMRQTIEFTRDFRGRMQSMVTFVSAGSTPREELLGTFSIEL